MNSTNSSGECSVFRLSAQTIQDPVVYLYFTTDGESTPHAQTGLSARGSYDAAYLSPMAKRPFSLTLTPAVGGNDSCPFWEVDAQLMPGLYGVAIPPFLRRPGVTFIYFHFPQTTPHYLQIHTVNYDPYDAFALGLGTWVRSNCHENLTSGLRKSMPGTLTPLLQEWFPGSEKG